MRSGKKSVRKERCYENRNCDLMIETVPGVILIGIEAPVQTVCKPYLKVFDELGIEPNEVEALMGKEKRTR